MDGIAIYPQKGGGVQRLNELLTALGPAALQARWRLRPGAQYVGVPVATLDAMGTNPELRVLGRDLLAAANEMEVLIDAVFEAESASDATTWELWLILRCVDSSWWEAYSDDAAALDRLRVAFSDVRPAVYGPDTVY